VNGSTSRPCLRALWLVAALAPSACGGSAEVTATDASSVGAEEDSTSGTHDSAASDTGDRSDATMQDSGNVDGDARPSEGQAGEEASGQDDGGDGQGTSDDATTRDDGAAADDGAASLDASDSGGGTAHLEGGTLDGTAGGGDAGVHEAGVEDASSGDAGPRDASVQDAGIQDASAPETGADDGSTPSGDGALPADAGKMDAGDDAGCAAPSAGVFQCGPSSCDGVQSYCLEAIGGNTCISLPPACQCADTLDCACLLSHVPNPCGVGVLSCTPMHDGGLFWVVADDCP
jgi:hypothetical protein